MRCFPVKAVSILIALALVFPITGCEPQMQSDGESFKIVTSFYPVMLVAKAVAHGANHVEVVNMTQPQTGCLHEYTLLPADMKALEGADVFVVNGMGMESFIDKAVSQYEELEVVTLSEGINCDNAHIWLNPQYTKTMAQNLCDRLVEADSSNAKLYMENTAAFQADLDLLDAEIRTGLQNVKTRDIITFHEAFPCFADAYGLNVAAVIEHEPGEEPSTGELTETVDVIKRQRIKALFAEPQYSSGAADVIANETGAQVYTLDPIVTGTNDEGPEQYFIKMRQNLETLQTALNQ